MGHSEWDMARQVVKDNRLAWSNAWSRAPSTVDYKGAVYTKAAAKSPEEQVWFTAAAAMQDPEDVLRMSPLHRGSVDPYGAGAYFLDADSTALNAAKSTLAQKQAQLMAVQGQMRALEAQRANLENQLARTHKDEAAPLGFLNILAHGAGIAQQSALDDVNSKIAAKTAEVEAAKADVSAAQAQVNIEQSNYAQATAQIRQQEEQQRLADLQAQQASQQAQAQAAADAAARQAQAQAASSQYFSMPSYSMLPSGFPTQPMPSQDALLSAAQGPAWDPFAGYSGMGDYFIEAGAGAAPDDATAGYYDALDFDGHGDPAHAADVLHSQGREAPGLSVYNSAFDFDRYYGSTADAMMERLYKPRRLTDMGIYDADAATATNMPSTLTRSTDYYSQEEARQQGGAVNNTLATVSKLLGAVLSAAPEILSQGQGQGPAPSTVNQPAPGTTIAEQAANALGLTPLLDSKAKVAGQEAGKQASQGAIIAGVAVAGALVVGAIVLSKAKKA